MTAPMVPEQGARLRWHRHVTARCAVAAAHLLTKLSPRRLRRALRAVSHGARPATAALTLEARTSVVAVSAWCAGRGCLERSIATALLVRLHGGWPDWCTGVRSQPFRAHAWVEAEGGPVGEPDDTALYRTVISVRHPSREAPSELSTIGSTTAGAGK